MPVDETLASYGDLAQYTALALYLLAMLLHAAELGAVRAAEPVRARAAAGGVATLERPGSPGGRRSPAERIGRSAVALTGLAAAVHAASLALRGLSTGRVPWGNMSEFTSAICLTAVVAWLVVLVRQRDGAALRPLGVFVLLPVVVLLFLAGTVLYADAAPLIPALRSYWIVVHVSTTIFASGILLLAGVASALYVLRVRADGRGAPSRLPAAEVLDRLAYRTTVVAFPVFTFGVITGAIWAEAAWGRYWGWDPKETVALVAWVVYAGYLHARATAGWRGSRSAWVNVVGFAVTVFNLFFINIVVAGLHSYAGV